MKYHLQTSIRRSLSLAMIALAASLTTMHCQSATAQNAPAPAASSADQAWDEVQKALQPPPEWRSKEPTDAERSRAIDAAIEQSRKFYARFPDDSRAQRAKEQHLEFLRLAVQVGNTNRVPELDALEADLLKQPNLPEDERFDIRARSLLRKAAAKAPDARETEVEAAVNQLQKEFPKQSAVYDLLLQIASDAAPEKAKAMARQVIESSVASETAKEGAQALVKKLEKVGKPVEIKFTAVDGTEVDLSKMKGKVVLIDFWATWCRPCMVELPKVKAAYDKLHPKGFEIIGISFDQSKEALKKVTAENKMTWPQYYDGKGWGNTYGKQFGIQSIPAMWLVDKAGNLRDLNAREDLESKVEKLLAEK